eukprot:gene13757-biopygen23071
MKKLFIHIPCIKGQGKTSTASARQNCGAARHHANKPTRSANSQPAAPMVCGIEVYAPATSAIPTRHGAVRPRYRLPRASGVLHDQPCRRGIRCN